MSQAHQEARRYKTIRKTCYTANVAYLLLHLYYMTLFLFAKLYVMAWVCAGIAVLYGLFFLLIHSKKYYPYVLCCGNEFLLFIIFASVMVGFSTGFHFFLIAFCIVSFFTTYFSKKKQLKGSFVWVGLSVVIYLSLFFVSEFVDPIYPVEKWLEITLFTTHAVIVFGLITLFLTIFMRYAMSLEKKIMNESRTDELTKISNRYGLYDYFDQIADRSNKVLAFFDIDDFKAINDTYGHVAGDVVLRKVAEIATKVLENGFVCRYGGEEFVVVLDESDGGPIIDRLETFRKAIEENVIDFEGSTLNPTVTIGAVKYRDKLTLMQWVELADQKMYSGKKSGKNKIVM